VVLNDKIYIVLNKNKYGYSCHRYQLYYLHRIKGIVLVDGWTRGLQDIKPNDTIIFIDHLKTVTNRVRSDDYNFA